MSIKVTTAVWERSASRLTDRLVLLYIADCCNHDGTGAWPAVSTIANACGISDRAVQLSLRALTDLGEIALDENAPKRKTNTYRVIVDNLGKQQQLALGAKSFRPEDSSPRTPKTFRPDPENFSPKPLVEPSVEPSPNGERAEARRLSKDERTTKRLALWKGYLNGLGLDEHSPSAASMKPAAFRSLTAPIVDNPAMNSATMTTLARWAKGYVKAWKATPPTVTECVNLYDYWNGIGRPRDYLPAHDPKFRQSLAAPAPSGKLTPKEAEQRWLDRLRNPDAWDGTERSKYTGKFGAENLARDIAASERALKEMQ